MFQQNRRGRESINKHWPDQMGSEPGSNDGLIKR